MRRAADGDDAVAGARQRLRDLDARAAVRADLADARAALPDDRARQLPNHMHTGYFTCTTRRGLDSVFLCNR